MSLHAEGEVFLPRVEELGRSSAWLSPATDPSSHSLSAAGRQLQAFHKFFFLTMPSLYVPQTMVGLTNGLNLPLVLVFILWTTDCSLTATDLFGSVV